MFNLIVSGGGWEPHRFHRHVPFVDVEIYPTAIFRPDLADRLTRMTVNVVAISLSESY